MQEEINPIKLYLHSVAASGLQQQVSKELELPDPVDYPNNPGGRLPFWYVDADE